VFSFIETRLFTRLVQEYLDDDEYRELQRFLMGNPETGNVIPGSGGAGVRRDEGSVAGIA